MEDQSRSPVPNKPVMTLARQACGKRKPQAPSNPLERGLDILLSGLQAQLIPAGRTPGTVTP